MTPLVIECTSDEHIALFSWDSIPDLYHLGHQQSVTLKAFASHEDISDGSALQLLQLTNEGIDLQIVDLTMGGDFLLNFREKRYMQGI